MSKQRIDNTAISKTHLHNASNEAKKTLYIAVHKEQRVLFVPYLILLSNLEIDHIGYLLAEERYPLQASCVSLTDAFPSLREASLNKPTHNFDSPNYKRPWVAMRVPLFLCAVKETGHELATPPHTLFDLRLQQPLLCNSGQTERLATLGWGYYRKPWVFAIVPPAPLLVSAHTGKAYRLRSQPSPNHSTSQPTVSNHGSKTKFNTTT
eukprot:989206-Amphidinium_carterae.1